MKVIDRIIRKKVFTFKSQGMSMFPLLRPDDILYFQKENSDKIKVNDIVLIKKNNKLLTHRIIYKKDKYFISKGDNNLLSDGKIYNHQIKAKLKKIKRNSQIFYLEQLYLFQSTFYFKEIIAVKKKFEKNKINYLFLKGLPLHLYYENSHPRRIYADCDLLIGRKNFAKACNILGKFNYKNSDLIPPVFSKTQRHDLPEYHFVKKKGPFNIIFDVHLQPIHLMKQISNTHFVYSRQLLDGLNKKLFYQKKYVQLQKNSFPIPSTPYLIIYLAYHFFHHNFRGINFLQFLDQVISKSKNINWELIARQIVNFKIQNYTYFTFILLIKYYQTKIPEVFITAIRPGMYQMRYIQSSVSKINIFNDETRFEAGINRFRNIFFLSPEPMYRRIFIFLNPAVMNAVFWVGIKKIKKIALDTRSFRVRKDINLDGR